MSEKTKLFDLALFPLLEATGAGTDQEMLILLGFSTGIYARTRSNLHEQTLNSGLL